MLREKFIIKINKVFIFIFIVVLSSIPVYSVIPVAQKKIDKEVLQAELRKEKEQQKKEELAKAQEIQKQQAIKEAKQKEEEKFLKFKVEEELQLVGENKNGVRFVSFNKLNSNYLHVREAMTTTVVFEEENIDKIILGDESSFFVEQIEDNMFIIFAQELKRDSSITVITEDKNVYPFYVKSLTYNTKETPDVVVKVRNSRVMYNNSKEYSSVERYNQVKTKKSADKNYLKEDYLKEAVLDPANIDWDYKMKGDKSIRPKRVWNDGYFTYIEFEEKDSAVLAYKMLEEVDTPINATKWEGNTLIVKTVGDITLRSGKKYVCIRPQSKKLKTKRNIRWVPFI